jgi:hypothetical protein
MIHREPGILTCLNDISPNLTSLASLGEAKQKKNHPRPLDSNVHHQQ